MPSNNVERPPKIYIPRSPTATAIIPTGERPSGTYFEEPQSVYVNIHSDSITPPVKEAVPSSETRDCGSSDADSSSAPLRPSERSCCSKTVIFLRRWRPLMLMIVLRILMGVSGDVVAPVFPGVKRRYFGTDQRAAFYTTIFQCVGAVLSLLTAPLGGMLMDRFGRRPFFLISWGYFLIPAVLWCFTPENPLPFMIVSCIGSVISGSFVNAYIADHYEPRARATAFALLFGFGTFSSVSTLLVLSLSDETCIILSAALQGVAFIITVFFVDESMRQPKAELNFRALPNPFRAMKDVLATKKMIAIVAVWGILQVSQLGVSEVYMYYLNQRIGFTRNDNAMLFLAAGIAQPIAFLFVTPIMKNCFKCKDTTLMLLAIVATALEMAVMCLISAKWQLFAFGMPLYALAVVAYPAMNAFVAEGPEEAQGRRQVGVAALTDTFNVIAPLFFGQTYSHLHGDWVILPFVCAGIACIPAFYLTVRLRHWRKETTVGGEKQTGKMSCDEVVVKASACSPLSDSSSNVSCFAATEETKLIN